MNFLLAHLWPAPNLVETKKNNQSMVLRVMYRGGALRFMGDIEAKGERELIATGVDLRTAIVRLPHRWQRDFIQRRPDRRSTSAGCVISLG